MAGLLVVCGADRAGALPSIAAAFEVAGCVGAGRGFRTDLDAPVFGSLSEGLPEADAVAVLTPYAGLAEDLDRCRDRGLPVAVAGPPAAGAADSDYTPGRWRHIPTLLQLDELRRSPSFGRPVYLRWLTGGGTALAPAWWAALEALEAGLWLLGGPVRRLWTAASTRGGRWQVTVTLVAGAQDRGDPGPDASAQLVVGPAADPGGDAMLLGTGGLVQAEGGVDGAVRVARDGSRQLPLPAAWPDAAWIRSAFAGERHGTLGAPLRAGLRSAIRRAARAHTIVPVDIPPAD